MSRVCAVTGRRTRIGHQVKRRGLAKKDGGVGRRVTGRSKRTFKPNIQPVRVLTPDGQVVTLKEAPGGVEITSLPDLPVGYRVIEVARDFVVLEAPGGAFEQRIPDLCIALFRDKLRLSLGTLVVLLSEFFICNDFYVRINR